MTFEWFKCEQCEVWGFNMSLMSAEALEEHLVEKHPQRLLTLLRKLRCSSVYAAPSLWAVALDGAAQARRE